MSRDREVRVVVLGEDKGGSKVLKDIEGAASKVGPASLNADKSLGQLTSTLASRLPVGGKQAKAMLDGIAGSLTDMSPAGKGAVAVFTAVTAAVGAGLDKFQSETAEVRKLKAALGSTAEEASGMRNVAVGLGVDVDSLAKGTAKLSVNLEKTGGDMAGVHVETARNADGTTNLVKTWDNLRATYQSIQDPQQKNIFLQQALAKGGLELRGVLSATNAEYAKMKNQGPIFHESDLKAGRDMAIAQREFKASIDSVEVSLARGLVPAIVAVDQALASGADWVDKHTQKGSLLGKVWTDTGHILSGQIGPFAQHASANKDGGKAAQEASAKFQEEAGALQDMGVQVDDAERAQGSLTKEHQKATAEAEKYKQKIDELGTSVSSAFLMMGGASADLSQKQRDQAKAFDATKDAADRLKQGIDILVGVHLSARESSIAWETAIDDTTAKLKGNKATLDIGTATGRENETQILAMVKAGLGHVDALQREGASSEQVSAAYQDHVQALKNVMRQAGYTEGQIETLIAQYGLVPDLVATKIAAYGLEYVNDGLDNIRRKLNALDGRTVTTYTNNVSVYHDDVSHGMATGGIIGMAMGGKLPRAAAGFRTKGPTIVGEGNPNYPEYVIPTDPMYRARSLVLFAMAAKELGGMAGGGLSGASGGSWNGGAPITLAPGSIVVYALDPHAAAQGVREELLRYSRRVPSLGLSG